MQSDRLNHIGFKQLSQAIGTQSFMMGIHTLVGNIFAQIMHQMAIIVEQAGGDYGRAFAILTGKSGALESVLRLRYVFAISLMTAFSV
jgi:hypothetical protein